MAILVPFQRALRPALPTVLGNIDYQNVVTLLTRIDQLLIQSGAEKLFVELSLQRLAGLSEEVSTKALLKHQQHSIWALRCMVLKQLLNEDYRELSRRLAECPLFQWFCQLDTLAVVKVPSKSTLQRYAHWLPEQEMRLILDCVLQAAAASPQETEGSTLGLANAIEMEVFWMDTTCIEANIHFPVDWVLLRDATRTLVKAITLIRKHGLKHRINNPAEFLSQMNRLCMEMALCRRQKESKKKRKAALRKMKQLVGVVARHARRYHKLLDECWQETDWSRKQAEQVLRRIDAVVQKLPAAKKQAHERIIGERQVPNNQKRISLYEDDVHVIVRGKAGAEVEFGNSLLLVEQADGLIVDHELIKEQAPADSRLVEASLLRVEKLKGSPVLALITDKGFDSKANRALLESRGAFNGICPRNAQELAERMVSDEAFAAAQKRRAQTEGRIGVLKNKFLKQLRAKGYEHRQMAVNWAVLTHNLWVLARMEQKETLSGSSRLAEAA